MAVDEILALKQRYNKADLAYAFEWEGQEVLAAFVTASLRQDPPNGYEITLIAPPTTVVAGQCFIIDQHGKKVGALGTTEEGAVENRITLTTLASKP